MAKIPIGTDGKPADESAYRAELDKLLKSLLWAAESGQPQREAYQKIQKKQKDRDELIDATRNGFLFTEVGQEMRGERTLTKYRMQPNPSFKSTSRSTSLYSRVRGLVWVDNESHQLARVEGEVTDDISLGVFLAKIYKGSHLCKTGMKWYQACGFPRFRNTILMAENCFPAFPCMRKLFIATTGGSDRPRKQFHKSKPKSRVLMRKRPTPASIARNFFVRGGNFFSSNPENSNRRGHECQSQFECMNCEVHKQGYLIGPTPIENFHEPAELGHAVKRLSGVAEKKMSPVMAVR